MAQDQRTSPSDATYICVQEEETNMGDVEEEKRLLGEVMTHEGMWPSSVSQDCCIYRVPNHLRRVNPDAYTPRVLLIGPLHHSKKADVAKFAEPGFFPDYNGETKSRYLGYLNMEQQKKIYLDAFRKRAAAEEEEDIVDQFRRTIKKFEQKIRQSYAESTDWIKSPEFVDMILHDTVFILEFCLRHHESIDRETGKMPRDLIIDSFVLQVEVFEDLILLENQLPYFLLEELFEPVIKTLYRDQTFRQIIITFLSSYGGDEKEIKETTEFKHFTDLLRSFRVETLDLTQEKETKVIKHLDNADKLNSRGVEFEAEENEYSLEVKFKKGRLRIPCITVHDQTEKILRNIMALEQCHYPLDTYVCSYILFLDFLIDTDKDVDLLVQKGVIRNWIGHQGSVAMMVNKLGLGVGEQSSLYHDTAQSLMNYRPNPIEKSLVTLRRVYFADLWKGTATVAAIALLLMTLVQTVASVIQILQNHRN